MRKPFQEKLTLDETNLRILSENRKKDISGPALFKQTFFGGIWNMMKTNWMMLLFCLPILVIYLLSSYQVDANNTNVQYSGNIGIGYPVINDAYQSGIAQEFAIKMRYAIYMVPMIIIAFVGLAGVFNVVKYFCWGMNVKIVKTFLRGIKNSFVPFVWVGLLFGLSYVLLIYALNVQDISYALRLLMIIGSVLFMVILLLFSIYAFTQGAVFNLSMFAIVKNSVLLGARFILQSVLILVAGSVAFVVGALGFLIPSGDLVTMIAQMLLMMIFFMMAFSFTATVWTIYSQSVFDMAYDARKRSLKEAKTAAVPEVSTSDKKSPAAQKKPQFKNPKKKKKS